MVRKKSTTKRTGAKRTQGRTTTLPGIYPKELDKIAAKIGSRYRYVEPLGSGKRGTTYKLRSEENPELHFCLKTISTTVSDPEEMARFWGDLSKEVKILTSMNHRNLPTIYEYEIAEKPFYYICTYHAGETCRNLLERKGRLPLEHSVFMIQSLLDVLRYLHSQRRTHCDLHSRNVMISEEVFKDGILVIDFGAGHRESGSSPGTIDGGTTIFKGTDRQGAYGKEVSNKEMHEHFKKSDFIALGILLAELAECLFNQALHEQMNAYLRFCSILKSGKISDWDEVFELFRGVVDPYWLSSGTQRLFSSSTLRERFIPLPVYGRVPVGDPILTVINTEVFQRLRSIKQLSFCEWYFPGAVHTRFEHSLGVFYVTKMAVEALARDPVFRATFDLSNVYGLLLAGLVHDLGHYPFAHAMEQYVASRFPDSLEAKRIVSHSVHTIELLRSDKEIIAAVNENWGENVMPHTIKILERKATVLSEVIDSSIDCDKIDYLARDSHHTGAKFGGGLDAESIVSS